MSLILSLYLLDHILSQAAGPGGAIPWWFLLDWICQLLVVLEKGILNWLPADRAGSVARGSWTHHLSVTFTFSGWWVCNRNHLLLGVHLFTLIRDPLISIMLAASVPISPFTTSNPIISPSESQREHLFGWFCFIALQWNPLGQMQC